MERVGMRIGAMTLAAAVEIPETGSWMAAARRPDDAPTWVRVAADAADARVGVALFERYRGLDHPVVPKAIASAKDPAIVVLSAPAGVPLSRLLENRHDPQFVMTPATVLAVGDALSDMIVVAHERGRPHGHLSPEHIWLTPEGSLVVWGFGRGPDQPGDPVWAAPERARGRRASGDTDQWSVAALLCALITGRVPWRSDDPEAEARIGDATHLWGPVSDQWKPLGRLLERCLATEPRDRFPSAHPVRQAIVALRQRVRADDDLARLGVLLAERYGLPGAAAVRVAAANDDAAVADAPPEVQAPDPAGAVTGNTLVVMAEDEAPTEAPDDQVRGPLGMVISEDEPGPVAIDADDAPTVVGEEPELQARAPRAPAGRLDAVELPAGGGAPPREGGDSTVWEDASDPGVDAGRPQPLVEVFNRLPIAEGPPSSPAQIDVRRVAGVSVAALVAVVLIWLVSGMP